MWLVRLPGVYRPQGDTWLLAAAMLAETLPRGACVLDVGTGTGALAVLAARRGVRRVTAIDVSGRAVLTARINAGLRRLPVQVRRRELADSPTDGTFHLVVANPPYLPSRRAEPPRRGAARSWDAGRDGRAVLDTLCVLAPRLLARGGVLLMVHSVLCGVEDTLSLLRGVGMSARVIDRRPEPFGPVMSGRAGWLAERGLLPAGARDDELVVIRAHRS